MSRPESRIQQKLPSTFSLCWLDYYGRTKTASTSSWSSWKLVIEDAITLTIFFALLFYLIISATEINVKISVTFDPSTERMFLNAESEEDTHVRNHDFLCGSG